MPIVAGYWTVQCEYLRFTISPGRNGFDVICDGEVLGTYSSPDAALEELVGGRTDWPGTVDPSELGLPDDLSEWAFFRWR